MQWRSLPIYKEERLNLPYLRMPKCRVLLRPEEVAAILRTSQRRVYQPSRLAHCSKSSWQARQHFCSSVRQLLPHAPRGLT
jgi:hypothetical protein